MTKPTKRLCAQRRLRSAWSECSLCTQWVAKDPSFLHVDREDWSDWADAQADLSLRWAHMPLCWFCHKAAHMLCVLINMTIVVTLLTFEWILQATMDSNFTKIVYLQWSMSWMSHTQKHFKMKLAQWYDQGLTEWAITQQRISKCFCSIPF